MSKLKTTLHYARAFRAAAEADGLRSATLRVASYLRSRIAPRLRRALGIAGRPPKPDISPFHDLVSMLGEAPVDRPLVLIVSDTRIAQCLHYRIHQKLRFLDRIGVRAMYFQPAELARIESFLRLAHTVIIYRTALDPRLIAGFRKAGVRVLFEVDDLVVGQDALAASGILSQVTQTQSLHLRELAGDLQATARACDALIVSTPHLAEVFARPGNGLDGHPCMVVPNFVETEEFAQPARPQHSFAFTSPSGSIRDELAMLTGFLRAYDAAATEDWSILVLGNDAARATLEAEGFVRGTVTGRPFAAFADYLATLSQAGTVLVPLSDSDFNRAKTPIRLMDAAVAGAQVVFAPVGAYGAVAEALGPRGLAVPSDRWAEAGGRIAPVLDRRAENVAALQEAVRATYGLAAGIACYREVFLRAIPSLPRPTVARADGAAAPPAPPGAPASAEARR